MKTLKKIMELIKALWNLKAFDQFSINYSIIKGKIKQMIQTEKSQASSGFSPRDSITLLTPSLFLLTVSGLKPDEKKLKIK